MKMKKITAFIVAILSVLTVATFAPIANVGAAGTPTVTSVKFVHGYDSYKFSYIVDQFDITLADGEAVKSYKVNDEETANTGAYVFKTLANDQVIEFFKNAEGTESLGSFTFSVVAKDSEGKIGYSVDTDSHAKYMEEVNKFNSEKLGASVSYPAITDLLVSELYPADALKLTIYTCAPNSQTFTSSTGKTIKLSELGKYSFYVLAQDPSENAIEIDSEKHERKTLNGIEGWYEGNDLVAPIFTFECSKVDAPKVSGGSSKVLPGYVGLTYKNIKDYITIDANGEKVEYKLYYSTLENNLYSEYKQSLAADATDEWASKGIAIINEALEGGKVIDVTDSKEYSAIGFSTSSLSFTPDQKGCYYLVVVVKDAYGSADMALNPIMVEAEVSEVKLEKQFLKYNWVSLMFLGIAVLCLIGIILLIFVKPKEATEEVVTEVVKK